MPSTSAPFGLRPVGRLSGRLNSNAVNTYPVASGSPNIGIGDPVILNTAGQITRAATPASDAYLGVFQGCYYNTTDGRFVFDSLFPTGQAGAIASVYDDPDAEYIIQTSTSIASTDVGGNANILTAAPSTVTKSSQATLDLSTFATTAGPAFRIRGLWAVPGNNWGDSYVIVRVNVTTRTEQHTAAGV
jgi:hypothetical protein